MGIDGNKTYIERLINELLESASVGLSHNSKGANSPRNAAKYRISIKTTFKFKQNSLPSKISHSSMVHIETIIRIGIAEKLHTTVTPTLTYAAPIIMPGSNV